MATPAPNNAFVHAGQLAANATDLAVAYPHGGIALGLVGDVDLVRAPLFRTVIREEDNAPEDVIWLGGPVEMVVTLKSWDSDAVERLVRGGSQAAGVPLVDLLANDIGRIPTKLANVVWSPVNTGRPFLVLRDVIAVPESDLRPRFSTARFWTWRLRLIACNVDGSLGGVGAAGAVAL